MKSAEILIFTSACIIALFLNLNIIMPNYTCKSNFFMKSAEILIFTSAHIIALFLNMKVAFFFLSSFFVGFSHNCLIWVMFFGPNLVVFF